MYELVLMADMNDCMSTKGDMNNFCLEHKLFDWVGLLKSYIEIGSNLILREKATELYFYYAQLSIDSCKGGVSPIQSVLYI